jgi:predicted dehydrogenase
MEILIIGLGSIAHKHVDAIKSVNPNAKIVALRSSRDSKPYKGVRDLFELDNLEEKPSFVIISNPTNMHSSAILEASRWGVPLFIEKPPLDSMNSAEEILTKLKKNNINTYVSFNLRFHPCLEFIKEFLKNNVSSLNEVNIYCGSYLPEWRTNGDYKNSYSASKQMGGGVHLDLIHELDYCFWLFGEPLRNNGKFSKKSKLEIDSPDFAQYLLEYDGFFVNCTLNYYRRDPKRTLELVFEDYTVTVDLLKCEIMHSELGVIFEHKDYQVSSTYERQMRQFIDKLTSNAVFEPNFNDSLAVLRIALNVNK